MAAAIITHAKSFDLSTMSLLSVIRYFLILNQFIAGGIFTSYGYAIMAVGLRCHNMKGYIFN